MRGRDNGLPDYNTVRKCFNLPMVSNWSDINPELYSKHPGRPINKFEHSPET